MFDKIHEVEVEDWEAYPKYSVSDSLPAFLIKPGSTFNLKLCRVDVI